MDTNQVLNPLSHTRSSPGSFLDDLAAPPECQQLLFSVRTLVPQQGQALWEAPFSPPGHMVDGS